MSSAGVLILGKHDCLWTDKQAFLPPKYKHPEVLSLLSPHIRLECNSHTTADSLLSTRDQAVQNSGCSKPALRLHSIHWATGFFCTKQKEVTTLASVLFILLGKSIWWGLHRLLTSMLKKSTALKTSCRFQRPKTILCLKGKAEEGTVVLLLPVLVIQVLKNCYVNWVVLPFPDKSALRRRLSLLHQYQHAIFLILGSSPDTAIDLPSQSMHSWNNYDTTQNIIFKESLPSSPQCKAEGHCFPYMSKLTDFWRWN